MPDLARFIDAEGKLNLIDLRPPEKQDESCLFQATPKQVELFKSKARFRMAIGGRGSGKSQFLLWEAVRYLTWYPGCHVLLLRKDFAELSKGLIQDLQNDVPRELYKYNGSDHIATWTNGSKLYFGHCEHLSVKDLNQYLSASFSFIGVEETGEFPFDIWDFLLGSNRNKVEGPTPTMAGATNPYGIGYGWIKTLFVEKRPVAQIEKSESYDNKNYFFNHSTLLDNPYLMRKDPDYINRLNLLSPELRQKMLYGDLDSVSGQYFTNFSIDRHVVPLSHQAERIKWEDWQPAWIGSDWGLAHFWTTYWMRLAMVKYDDKWKRCCVIYRELVDHEKSIAEYTRDLNHRMMTGRDSYTFQSEKIEHVFFSPERFNRTSPENTPADQFGDELRKYNLPPPSKATDDRVAGATFMYSMLDANELIILDCCPHLIRALPTLIRGGDSASGKNIEDVLKSDTLEDDCYDGARYGIVSKLHERTKPAEVVMREHAMQIADPLARHHFVRKQTAQQDKASEYFKPNVGPRWRSGE